MSALLSRGLLPALTVSVLILSRLPASAQMPTPDSEAFFHQFVQPVLESSCVHCHGADEQKGELQLDSLDACLTGGDAGPALVPGDPDKSPLFTSTQLPADDDDVMPPSKEPPLVPMQAMRIREWIAAGAKWPAGVTLKQEPRMQFVRDIQPILEMNCVSCHNPEKTKGDLDMTTLEKTMKGGEDGPALVPFDADNSPLHKLTILPADDDDLMPPQKSGGPLSKEQIEKLRLWVRQGAAWPEGIVLAPKVKTEERPPNPDNAEMAAKIHGEIVAKSSEKAEADMKAYTGTIPKTGKEYQMVPIPGGEFTMGSPATEADRKDDEGPQVKVKVDPFWMGAYEVSWDQYMPFMITQDARWKDGAKKTPKPGDTVVDAVSSPTAPYTDMTFGMGQDKYPAISMTQHAALKFCEWLSAQTGHFYRLPTEAEWEYAARAGTDTPWFFGSDASKLGDYAWYFENSDGKTQQIGQKKPSPWGLYDIYGNVVEWTLDQYVPDQYSTLTAGVANPFHNPETLYPRTVRGGSWDDDPKDLRSAARRGSRDLWKQQDPQLPKSIWYHTNAQFLGFRIVRPLKVPSAEEMHHYWSLGIPQPAAPAPAK